MSQCSCSDTAKIVARVLTSRAVQRILIQLQETDLFVAHWLADYCNAHPPMTGDKVMSMLSCQHLPSWCSAGRMPASSLSFGVTVQTWLLSSQLPTQNNMN